MMICVSRFAVALLSLASFSDAIAYTTPRPTTVEDDLARVEDGWTPKPTEGPLLELLKRDNALPDTCGWYLEGTSSREITCPKGTCMLFTPSGIVGMAGCCTSSLVGSKMDYQNCGWVNKCYDYSEYKGAKCTGDCLSNQFHRVCTDVASPYCLSWTYPAPAVRDYGCGTASHSTWIAIQNNIRDDYAGTNTANLPYIPVAATVTGWQANAKGSGTPSSRSGTGTSTSLSSTAKPSAGVTIVGLIAIIVAVVLCLCCCGGIITFCLVRRKRNKAKLNNPSGVAGGAVTAQQAIPLMHQQQGNIVSPPGQYGQQQPGYFPQGQMPQTGAAAGYYNEDPTKVNAMMGVQQVPTPMSTPGTPAPQYQQAYPVYNQQQPQLPRQNVAELHSTPVVRAPDGGHVAELG
ncbi:hypothetical protein EJ08DRAFT_234216 [Tothia fuscella]|uniref:Transmembrane protein n=1 Tax=Tothia fuscella TaxID=1048955 RepID=A0A9P4P401_9PEZI|nr:hypothetical protein EJ08DRAFT_234216 [Tothia fuscella]